MELQRLSLTNFRAFKQAEFEFKPGMNLIVGINGVGKSSVLDAIRIMLSRVMPQISQTRNHPLFFTGDDISVNEGNLSVSIKFEFGKTKMEGLGFLPREKYSSTDTIGDVRDQAYELSNRYEFHPDPRRVNLINADKFGEPLVVFFSTSRSMTTRASQSRNNKSSGPNSDALAERELRIREFAEWWLVQRELMRETNEPIFGNRMEVLSDTISSFFDAVDGLRAIGGDKTTLVVNKNNKVLDVSQLSDGERGMLSLVFDLARRLAQANAKLKRPLEGKAIVLIDELDLHLHPRWQRDIVRKLTETFPNCQFIATTHSPQIVGEVSPENIIILEDGMQPYRPDQALGMDTNWILQFLMGSNPRNKETQSQLDYISDLIEEDKFELAQKKIDSLREEKLARDPELVKLQVRLDRLRILKDDNEG